MKGNIKSPVCPPLPAAHRIKAASQTAGPYVHIPRFDTELSDPSNQGTGEPNCPVLILAVTS